MFFPNLVKSPENCVNAVSGDCRTFALVNSCEDAFPSRARQTMDIGAFFPVLLTFFLVCLHATDAAEGIECAGIADEGEVG